MSLAVIALCLLMVEGTALGDRLAPLLRALNLVIFVGLGLGAFLRWRKDPGRFGDLQGNWIELATIPPLVLLLIPFHFPLLDVLLRETAIAVILIGRARRSQELLARIQVKPARVMFPAFLLLIAFGTPWLMLPESSASGAGTSFLDAFFTATSAVCVTGLTVRDTASHFNGLGQFVVLVLIQLGGLGIMTFSATMLILLRKPVSVLQQASLQTVLDHDALADIRKMVWFIVGMTFCVELAGAVALAVAWRHGLGGWGTTAWHAVFHSVSAFCNAGFSTFSDNLCRFRSDVWTNGVIMALIVLGGLGFIVVRDLKDYLIGWYTHPERRSLPLRVQTKLVLVTTFLLTLLGAVVIYLAEAPKTLAGLPVHDRILVSLFQSVTARTAGFNTVDLAQWSGTALLTLIVLMVIGGSPGSTAGGVKTTTFAVLWGTLISELRRRDTPELYRRAIPVEVIRKAVALVFMALLVIIVFAGAMMITEGAAFVRVLFECVSAFGTVGLSLNLTPDLTPVGKVLVCALMFIGRLGPLALAYAFVRHGRSARYAYAEERIMIG